MNENVVQVLLILAYLAIGLISVTFPIYAICVTYLRQEKWESEKERKKRIESLKKHIAELTDELSGEPKDSEPFKQIQDRIEKHQNEKDSLEYLTAKGAVRKPVILLALALVSAILGIQFLYIGYMELELALICGIFSGAFSIKAVYRLYKTISSIEYAALRPARTIEFIVSYEGRKESKEIKLKKEVELRILAGTDEDYLENVTISVFIPPSIELKRILTSETFSALQSEGFTYANYMMVDKEIPFLSIGTSETIMFTISAKKTGKFGIFVKIRAKGIYPYIKKLTLDVVK